MKASKFIVLVGGILGLLAFFLPMVSVERGDAKVSVSAFQVVKGLDEVSATVGSEEVKVKAAAYGDVGGASVAEAQSGIEKIKGIILAFFAPALLLAAIGGLGVARKKFGRVAGTFSLLLGLVGLGVAVMLRSAAEGDAGAALTVLLLTGVAGVVGGILALAKPERGLATA